MGARTSEKSAETWRPLYCTNPECNKRASVSPGKKLLEVAGTGGKVRKKCPKCGKFSVFKW